MSVNFQWVSHWDHSLYDPICYLIECWDDVAVFIISVLDTTRVAQLYVEYTRYWRAEGETMPKWITIYNSGNENCIWTRACFPCRQKRARFIKLEIWTWIIVYMHAFKFLTNTSRCRAFMEMDLIPRPGYECVQCAWKALLHDENVCWKEHSYCYWSYSRTWCFYYIFR